MEETLKNVHKNLSDWAMKNKMNQFFLLHMYKNEEGNYKGFGQWEIADGILKQLILETIKINPKMAKTFLEVAQIILNGLDKIQDNEEDNQIQGQGGMACE